METKKNPKLDFRKYRGLFFNVGLVVSLGLVLTAFEWKTPQQTADVDFTHQPEDLITLTEVKPTVIPPPPKPKVEVFKLIEKPDTEIIKEIEVIVQDPIFDDPIEEPVFVDQEPKEEPEVIFDIVESQPTFMDGGQAKFLQYVGSKLRYPNQARRLGIEGKVFVQFVIDKNGKMSDIQVLKGIGAGCDEEVLRVLNDAPAWEPGKQRGVPVKVRMIVPVSFRLNK